MTGRFTGCRDRFGLEFAFVMIDRVTVLAFFVAFTVHVSAGFGGVSFLVRSLGFDFSALERAEVANFFDGFGFNESEYRKKLGWTETPLDRLEKRRPPKRPLLPALVELNQRLPQKWDNRLKKYVRNDDWLLWDIHDSKVEDAHD